MGRGDDEGVGERLRDPVLDEIAIEHGFAFRPPARAAGVHWPRQVHGSALWRVDGTDADPPEADAVLGTGAGTRVGIVTADCVPLLAALEDGSAVVAIHAGWRGLAAGVIEAGLSALADVGGGGRIVAAVGPAARGCCYEVDEPVRTALSRRHRDVLDDAVLRPVGDGRHHMLDLPRLASRVALRAGVDRERLGTRQRRCTICDPARFESHRRDGEAAGRLGHFVAVASVPRAGA